MAPGRSPRGTCLPAAPPPPPMDADRVRGSPLLKLPPTRSPQGAGGRAGPGRAERCPRAAVLKRCNLLATSFVASPISLGGGETRPPPRPPPAPSFAELLRAPPPPSKLRPRGGRPACLPAPRRPLLPSPLQRSLPAQPAPARAPLDQSAGLHGAARAHPRDRRARACSFPTTATAAAAVATAAAASVRPPREEQRPVPPKRACLLVPSLPRAQSLPCLFPSR